MDDLLGLYTEPLPTGEEYHCFDETPKQLLGTPRGGSKAKPGKSCRLDYEYKRNGRRNIFVAVAPLIGTRTVSVTKRRTAIDTADFLWHYVMEEHKDVKHIHLILDNLNTHQKISLQKVFGEEKAVLFFSRVTLHFTPPHASWLNMAELEINCLKAQGLKKRLPTEEELNKKKDEIVSERNSRKAKINWSFAKEKARKKFPMLYSTN